MRFCVLGPLEVVGSDGPIALGSPKQRRLMAVLISQVGEPVSVGALVDAVWEEGPPRSAAKTLQGYVVHLRQAMASAVDNSFSHASIATTPAGYQLDVAPHTVDAVRFTELVGKGRHAAAERDWTAARVFLSEGRSLWRGPAYVEFADSGFAAAEAGRLEQLRLVLAETGFETELALGEDAALVPDLEKALTQEPTRERLWELLIRALYLSGRQSDALLAYVRAREVLAKELGVDPGSDLRAVHAAVLAQNPSLDRGASAPTDLTARQPRSGAHAFDGRDEELAWLRGLWLAVHEGGGRSAVVSGPTGIGKTRLLAAFADEVQRSGAVVVRRTGLTAPSLATVASVSGGGPALVVLDDPLTGLDVGQLAELPILVVAGLDPAAAPDHVRASLAGAEWRELQPLLDDVGARIARRWLGEGSDPQTVQPILEAAAGNPGRLHRLLSEAVEARSQQQIGAAVQELRIAHDDLAASRAEVAHGVRGLRRGRTLAARRPGTPHAAGSVAECPYLGLDQYELGDAELFHGRDALVEHLVARVVDTPLVAVVGASGTGKSSLVKAGLLAALAAGCLPDSGAWPRIVVTPDDPLPESPATPAVVVVDQFEQAWVAYDDVSRPRYLDAVVALADSGCRVVLTLRADHVERCSQHPELRDLVAGGTVLLGPLTGAEMTQVITGPAELAGCIVEPALVDRILDDVRGLTAPLPLVSTALAETWGRAVAGDLSLDVYLECGGVAGALARRAEAAYAALTEQEQAAARHVMLRLATGERGLLVRRRCPYPEAVPDEPASRAVEALSAARLVTVDAGGVEVAHEALFANWPRLTDWLDEDEQGRRLRAHLAPTALEWNENGRPEADLYRGVRLEATIAMASDSAVDLTPTEREFVIASEARAEHELRTERERGVREARGRRRLRGLLTAVAATAVLALVATVVAVGQRNTASDNARLATARELGAAALINQPLDHSLLLAASAVAIDDNASTRSDLLAALQRAPAAQGVWRGDGLPLYQLVLTDHDRTAVASGISGVSLWSLADGRSATATGLFENDFTPLLAGRPGTDEVALANRIGLSDFAPNIQLWDPRTQHPVGSDLAGSTSRTSSMAWTADGRWLAAGQQTGDVLVWDSKDHDLPPQHIRRYRPVDVSSQFRTQPVVFPVVVYAGGQNFAVVEQSGAAQVASTRSRTPIRTFSVGVDVTSVASDRSGAKLAVGHRDGRVALLSLIDGRPLQAVAAHSSAVKAVTFSPDGRLLASLGDDDVANVTDVGTGRLVSRLGGHTAPVTAAAFAADSRSLYTASVDGTVIGWNLADPNNLGVRLSADQAGPSQVGAMATSPSGELAMGYADGTVRIWGSDGATPTHRLKVSDRSLTGIALSLDGRVLAAADAANDVSVVDVASEQVVNGIAHLPAAATALSFSPDGRRLVAVDTDFRAARAHFFAAPAWRQVSQPELGDAGARQVVWSPDSRRIAIAFDGGPTQVLAADTGSLQWQGQWELSTFAAAWSPDGSTIAVGGDGEFGVRFVRAADGSVLGRGWADHVGTSSVAYNQDGSIIASTGWDETVVLRDVATGDRIGPPLEVSQTQDQETLVGFDVQGQLLVAAKSGAAWRWDIRLPHLLRAACLIAGRNLTRQEWADLHTGRPYVSVCS